MAEAAARRGTPLRVLGGVAVGLLCPSSRRAPLARAYADIDFASVGGARDDVVELLESLGYAGDREFNVLHGHRRLLFWDPHNERQLDVFLDEANLCHRIGLENRVERVPLTLPLADLAVLKLQIVETNEKDYLDICAIFADYELTEDDTGIDATYIARIAASDWGLWRTMGMVAERSERFALELRGFDAGDLVAERLRQLRREMYEAPKTRGWKLRSRIGERKRWYELPEEVH
ncbi:MAG TPA: hypothetical protein VFL77_07160 [Solirubrobacterales bacterium]|nr:hypothetical protein [Solirubrobacterales bacterium]